MLTKEQILQADDLPRELVQVPEWGGEVYVRTLKGFERDAFESSVITRGSKNVRNIRARFAVLCMCDESGGRVFEDADAEPLGQKNAKALDRIFGVAQRLNGFTEEDVEGLAKNSEPVPSDDSGSS